MKYRDATYSEATQEQLVALITRLTNQPGWLQNIDEINALADVIERWEKNDATETEIDA